MEVVRICEFGPRVFTLDEAKELVPLLIRITTKHEKVITRTMADQRFYMKTFAPQRRVTDCDNKVCAEMTAWGRKVCKLGCKVFSGGYVGMDSGSDWYSWHFGEPKLMYRHNYEVDPSTFRRALIYD